MNSIRKKTSKWYVLSANIFLILFLTFFTAPIPGNALFSDGTEDTAFYTNLGTGFGNSVETIKEQPDGKIVVGGRFTQFKNNTRNRLVRLNSDGTEDTAFYTNLGTGFSDYITSTYFQPDGKIVVGGRFTTFKGVSKRGLVRLNSDGTEDTAFYTNLGTGFTLGDSVDALLIQPLDEKILVGGIFNSLNGNTRNRLVRLNSDGTEDTDFYTNLGVGFNSQVLSIKLQDDGKILVGGTFTQLNGNTRNRLVRLNSDGTEDTDFYTNLGVGFGGSVLSVKLQDDGKILVGGAFNTLNGNTRYGLVRLNSDGTEDTAFYTNLGTGFSSSVSSLELQSDDKIIVGGSFGSFNSGSHKFLVRLNSDGTEDTAFYTNLGTGFGSYLSVVEIQSNNDLLIGGGFTQFKGNTRNRLVRLTRDISGPITSEVSGIGLVVNNPTPSYTFTTNEAGTITYGGSCSSDTTSATLGTNTITFNSLSPGTYDNCTITVTDIASNPSTPLAVSSFSLVVHGGGGGGTVSTPTESTPAPETSTTPETETLITPELPEVPEPVEPIITPVICNQGESYSTNTGQACTEFVSITEKIIPEPETIETPKPILKPKEVIKEIINEEPLLLTEEIVPDVFPIEPTITIEENLKNLVSDNPSDLGEKYPDLPLYSSSSVEEIEEVSVLQFINNQAVASFVEVKEVLNVARDKTREILETKEGDIAAKAVTIGGVVAGTSGAVAGIAFATPLSFSEIPLIPVRMWTLFLGFLGVKKRTRRWGVVYDSLTKQPLDPAYITLKNLEGKVVATTITDIDGRYGFVVDKGSYLLDVKKTHYAFPSIKLSGKMADELYDSLYLGDVIEVSNPGEVVAKNIPLDPVSFSWNESEKDKKGLTSFFHHNDLIISKIFNYLFLIGFAIAVVALLVYPAPYNGIILALYLTILIIKKVGIQTKKKGSVVEKNSGLPFKDGMIRLFYSDTGPEIAHATIDQFGKFYCLVKNGTYKVSIEKKNPDGSYTLAYQQNLVTVTNGVLNMNFAI